MDAIEVGSVHASFSFGADEHGAGAVWKEVERVSTDISCWRYCSPDRKEWYVTVMAEEKNRHQVERATRIAESQGGTPSDEAEKSGMIDALRRRRLAVALDAVEHDKREVRQRANYDNVGGMRLGRDGAMTPERKGQG